MADFREFHLPVRVEDLESYERTGEGRYVIDEVQDVTVIQAEDQIATIRALFTELGRSPVLHIHQPHMIGVLYSFIKGLATPGALNKEVRALIVHECAEKLTRLLTHVANHIQREKAGGGVNVANLGVPRSCTKMYVFAICNVLLSGLNEEEAAAASGAPILSQPVGRPRGARGRLRGAALAADEDASGVDISGREQAVTALTRVFDSSLGLMWRDQEHVEDPVLTLILRLVLHLLSQKCNVDGDHNAVCGSISALLAASSQSITQQFLRGEAARLADGTANTTPDPSDLIVTPLVELLLKQSFTSKFLARWMSNLDSTGALNEQWSGSLLKSLFEGIVHAACEDVVGETQSAKHITSFMEELSRNRISFVSQFSESIALLLDAESYEIRKAGISVSAEVIVQRFTGSLRDAQDEQHRDKILRELLSRTLDLNPFTRTHCLHQWGELVKKKAVPRSFFISITEAAIGRLEDRNHLVRNAAMQLVADIMRRNWFSTVLTRQPNSERMAQHTAEAKQRFLLAGKTEQHFLDAWAAARSSLRPLHGDRQFTILNDEDTERVGDVEPDILLEDENAADSPLTPTDAAGRASRGSLAGFQNATQQEPNRGQQHDPDILRLVYFENALVFIGLLETALAQAVELLESGKNERNIIEAIRFIVVCSEYRLDGSTPAVLRFLVMIFEGEQNIQAAVREAFYAVFFQSFLTGMPGVSPLRRTLASVLKLVSVLRSASEGEVNAVHRLFRVLKQENHKVMSDLLYDAVWSVVDGSVDANTAGGVGGIAAAAATQERRVDPLERRTAMRLYSILVAVNPRDVTLRRAAILDLMARNGSDNVLLAYGFQSLQCESSSRTYTLIDDAVDPNQHPVLCLVVRHLCRSTNTIGSWMPLAEACITTIHSLCLTPIILYTSIVQHLAKVVDGMTDAQVTKRFESDAEFAKRVSQLLFIIGHTALKHLVSIDSWERAQLKAMEAPAAPAAPPAPAAATSRSARSSGVLPTQAQQNAGGGLDVMHKELGMGSSGAKRHEIEETAQKKRRAMLEERHSIWKQHASLVVHICKQKPEKQRSELRAAAVLCLSKLMIASPDYATQHMPLLFTVASNKDESWVIKTNSLLAIGDLACVHPNIVEPFMKIKDAGLFALLQDNDNRVRAVTVQICSHLVLSEMLRIGDRLDTIVRLVADPDPAIRANAATFVKNFALKNRRGIGNMIPPLIPVLSDSMPTEAFQEALKTLLEKVEKDKPTESLIEKLCSRFGSFTDKSRSKRCIARNLAFCLSELDYTGERTVKKLSSEQCYQLYKQWLRDEEVLASFQVIAVKARKGSGGGAFGRGAAAGAPANERRDKAAIEEWEARLLSDASIVEQPAGNAVGADEHAAPQRHHYDEDGDEQQQQSSPSARRAPMIAGDDEETPSPAARRSGTATSTNKKKAAAPAKRGRAAEENDEDSSSSSSSSSSDDDEDTAASQPRASTGRGGRGNKGGAPVKSNGRGRGKR
ncbi:condensin subunit, putative [Bodo saltans]|uniref:Condensin subunit, putative n=1 Tax=Bodo saltans TaxID=75058 RepID=A0A0S4JEY8_BODSA|nr:condensin subunit, putative [Bodo saltans]|eukprot:CUG86946.1 condensin subunit, putative [Bodo saltans]